MSLVNEDDSSAIQASQSINGSETKPIIRYTRDLLLSLSELEICKKLPSGFDQSILSEFEENSIQERHKTHASSALQGFRRNDYSSSPPTRGDSSNYSRGGHGRWDNRWSDKDGDSQSDLDPDSGRRGFGNQSRRPRQNSEHDGLLGSGSFPRPSGFTAGTSAPKGSTNETKHLNRSTEAYQPPRPFKAVPHSRPNTHDSFNDETFGSSDSTSQDRAEEERKRRASFEIMRKEQQKVLQEKQKSSGNKLKGDGFTDLMLDEVKEEGALEASSELNSAAQSVPKDDSGKSFNLSKPRPLVPPGFKSTINEKNSTIKSTFSSNTENPKPGIEEINLFAKTQNGTIDNQSNIQLGFPEVNEPVDGEVFELMTNKVTGIKVHSNSSQESSAAILGNFFGRDPTVKDGGSTGFLEQKSKPDNPPSLFNVQSSKFAQWFNDDEKNSLDDLSSSRTNDLLSLIGGGDKAGTQVPKFMSDDPITSELSYTGFGTTETPSNPKHLFNNFKQDSAPPLPATAVLTCEDLEQTILSEYSEKSSTLPPPPVPTWTVSGEENTDVRNVDNHATHHLLSLLQKGPAIDDSPNTNIGLLENRLTSEKPKDGKQGGLGQNLSLEALFGTAFMKELQSAQAPVSAQRASAGSARIDISSTIGGIGPDMSHITDYESNPLSLKQPAKSDDPESWSKFDGQRADVDLLEFQKGGEIQLPEEESLIIVGDPANTRNPNIGKMLPSDVGFDISEKLAALNSGFRGDHFVRGPYDMLEPERIFNNNLHTQASSPQIHNRRPMFHPLDPNNPQNMNSQIRYPEHMQRDSPLNQQFPSNMPRPFNHPDARVTGFDVPVHSQMLPPQMRMQGNFLPPHVLRDLQRPGNQASNFMPDHGFPFGHQQTNIGGIGMPLPVPDGNSGSNHHPEAFQRMLEMEVRAQSKQVRPVNNTQGILGGHELDMGFRYR